MKLGLRWRGTELAALRHDYECSPAHVDAIARSHRTSRGQLMRLAKRHGWTRRQAERLPPEAHAHWNTYRNVQRYQGRAKALEVVAGLHAAVLSVEGAVRPAAGVYVPSARSFAPRSVRCATHGRDVVDPARMRQPERAGGFPGVAQ